MKSPKPYLEHILQECEFLIEESKKLGFEDFIKDPVLMRAFVRSLEIIGEVVKNMIAGMRDKLIHEYFGINYKIVWKTVIEDIPKLKEKVEEILKKKGWM